MQRTQPSTASRIGGNLEATGCRGLGVWWGGKTEEPQTEIRIPLEGDDGECGEDERMKQEVRKPRGFRDNFTISHRARVGHSIPPPPLIYR